MAGRFEQPFVTPVSKKSWEAIFAIDFGKNDEAFRSLLLLLKESGNSGIPFPGFSINQLTRLNNKLEEKVGYRLNLVHGTGPSSHDKSEARFHLVWAKLGKK